jgi:hypothetical protein
MRPKNPFNNAEDPVFIPGDKVRDRRDIRGTVWRITRRIAHHDSEFLTLRRVEDDSDERTAIARDLVPYLEMVTPVSAEMNAIDPFQRAKDIRAGKLDHEMPNYNELCQWIQRVPKTWLGGLLRQTAVCCVHPPFFASDEALIEFVRRAIDDSRNPASVLREARDIDCAPRNPQKDS